MALTKEEIQKNFPEVYESYTIQLTIPEDKYEEKLHFWEQNCINCFERWTVPYFLEREKERKRPCLRLNYPPDGKCNECARGTCKYDRVCFMCGMDGHGAFQSFPGGKLKGELKCAKHRNFLAQLAQIRSQHGFDEEDLRELFKGEQEEEEEEEEDEEEEEEEEVSGVPSASPSGSASLSSANTSISTIKTPAAGALRTAAAVAAAAAAATTSSSAKSAPGPASTVAAIVAAGGGGGGKKSTATATATATQQLAATAAAVAVAKKQAPHPTGAGSGSVDVPAPASNNEQQLLLAKSSTDNGLNIDHHDSSDNGLLSSIGGLALHNAATTEQPSHGSLLGVLGSRASSDSLGSIFSSGGGIGGRVGGSPTLSGIVAAPGWGAGTGTSTGTMTNDIIGGSGRSLLSGLGLPPAIATNSAGGTSISINGPAPGLGAPPAGGLLTGGSGSGSFGLLSNSSPAFEVNESNNYSGTAVLRFNTSVLAKDSISGGPTAYKGTLTGSRGTEEVAVYVWRKNLSIDISALNRELKTIRILSQASGGHISRVLHKTAIDIQYPSPSTGGTDLSCLVSEYSEFGTLDRHIFSYFQIPGIQPDGFSITDIQSIAVQLIETLVRCHAVRITHRDIRPQNILVSKGDKFQTRQFAGGFILKLSDFRRASLAGLGFDGELDQWTAPEVPTVDCRAKGEGYLPSADVWSLGLVLYFVATGGQFPFESLRQARDAVADESLRKSCLEKHGLQQRSPLIFDLIERMVRPVQHRISLPLARCHPLLWTTAEKKSYLISFADSCNMHTSESVEAFANSIDRFGRPYVFDNEGWVKRLKPELVAFINPPSLKSEFWWSAKALLQAIKNHLQFPEVLSTVVYPRLTANQVLVAYLHQVLDSDFPKLLILLYELSGLNGKWEWDGDEINHSWN